MQWPKARQKKGIKSFGNLNQLEKSCRTDLNCLAIMSASIRILSLNVDLPIRDLSLVASTLLPSRFAIHQWEKVWEEVRDIHNIWWWCLRTGWRWRKETRGEHKWRERSWQLDERRGIRRHQSAGANGTQLNDSFQRAPPYARENVAN